MRSPARAAEAMVASSQPLATRAGLRSLERGGTAVDAALAAAAMLTVTEPRQTGPGADAFAIVWDGIDAHGLDAAGPAPRNAFPVTPVERRGPRSVVVPGAIAGWAALADRFGRFELDAALVDAIDAVERGIVPPEGRPPSLRGQVAVRRRQRRDRETVVRLARTLRLIAEQGPDAVYRGDVAQAIVASSWLEESDLRDYEPRWVRPLEISYRGVTVCEMPPSTQGVAALEGLGLLALGASDLASQVACVRLALEDAYRYVHDAAQVDWLLDAARLRKRRTRPPVAVSELAGGTVYLCAVDREGMAVSFIQSLYQGAGIEAGETGVLLSNRAACFSIGGQVEPGLRPFNTNIPGMLFRDGALLGPFGVVGGFSQAQCHVQLVSALIDDELDPQAALDRARFWIEGETVHLEEGLWGRARELAQLGCEVVHSGGGWQFGAGQAILVEGDHLLGGSDVRRNGCAAGL